jgi:two-component system response regulator
MPLYDPELLLVEDHSSDAELILLALGTRAERTYLVHDGEEALDYLFCRGSYSDRSPDARPRLIFLDLKLPKVDGLEVLRQIKQDPRTASIPVVMLTSSRIEQDVAAAYRLGVNSYVQKPVEFAEFRDTVLRLGEYWFTINEPPPARAFWSGDAE